MLILTRRVGESIKIGEDVELVVLGIRGNHITVGVKADRAVQVHRAEVWERLQGETATEEPS